VDRFQRLNPPEGTARSLANSARLEVREGRFQRLKAAGQGRHKASQTAARLNVESGRV
jgi:hypothetical protein